MDKAHPTPEDYITGLSETEIGIAVKMDVTTGEISYYYSAEAGPMQANFLLAKASEDLFQIIHNRSDLDGR
jgi:hypothetical protein